jgi:alanine racemase
MLNWIEIDEDALRHNYQQFLTIAGGQDIAPVLKSNAYGHGFEEVYTALSKESPKWICVNYVSEAAKLRDLGYKKRILVVGPASSEFLNLAAKIDAEIVVGNAEILDEIISQKLLVKIHLKFDTGMNRQGFKVSETADLIDRVKPIKSQIEGISTHFANVEDVTDQEFADLQLSKFRDVGEKFTAAKIDCLHHIASSASCLLMDNSRPQLSRIGISLYGFWPSKATRISYLQTYNELLELRPVLSWFTEISSIKEVGADEFIGYGCTYKTTAPTRIAVLPVGYYEGYPRIAGDHKSFVLVGGKRCSVIGRICMNMMMVDITHLQSVSVGDKVTLLGADKDEEITASDLAGWSQTIHYELVARLNAMIPRKLISR